MEANGKCMKDYHKNKESLMILKYCDVNHLYGWAIKAAQKLPVDVLRWLKIFPELQN